MKTYEELKFESTLYKFIIHFAGIIAVGITILCIIISANDKTRQGTYHDYNKAIIIYGKNDGIVIDLAGYDHITLGTERYELYSTDGKQYSASPDDVILYNDTE